MHTNDTTAVADGVEQPAATPGAKPGWPGWAVRSRAWLKQTAKNTARFVTTDPAGAAALVGTALGGALTFLLVFSAVVNATRWLVSGHVGHDLVTQLPVVRIATDPVGHWLGAHLEGLPLTTSAAAGIWVVFGAVLFCAASRRHLGAQLLWPAYGIATVAMAWSGTDIAAHRPVVVGLIAVAWGLLSLLALRRRAAKRR